MSGGGAEPGDGEVEGFIARWRASEGAERAAYAQFLTEFCRLIGVETPLPPTSDAEAVTYRFEYPVKFRDPSGATSTGRIDLYKKSCFVLYADFTGPGKNYVHFPDRHRFRVYLKDLRDPAIRAWIARI